MAGNSRRPGESVASRMLAVLDTFNTQNRYLGLSEIARRADLPVATAHRLVAELVAWGALIRQPGGDYTIGQRLWDLGMLAPMQRELTQVASPFLHDIYGATLATVHLAVRDRTTVLYVDRLSGHASVPIMSDVGSRLPMHATAVGKVLLAHAPQDVQVAVLSSLRRMTAHTITQSGRLRAELGLVRRDGFAQTSEEMSLGACSIAVPILDGESNVIAALGIVVPRLRGVRSRLLASLKVASLGISRSLAEAETRR